MDDTNKLDEFANTVKKFETGKQIAALLCSLFVLLNFSIEIFSFHDKYTATNFIFQLVTLSFVLIAIALYSLNRKKYYRANYTIISYVVILNILFSPILFPEFHNNVQFNHSDFFSRNIYFIICLISFSGFIIGKRHIIVQGTMLLFVIVNYCFLYSDNFILRNAPIYVLSAIGFCVVMHFWVSISDKFIKELQNSFVKINEMKNLSDIQNKKLSELNEELKIAMGNLKDTQQHLIEAEKNAAFGTLATRMAHEIQNPLNFVNNFSAISKELLDEILSPDISQEEKQDAILLLRENLEKINHHGIRASQIINQLQEHNRMGTTHEFFDEKK